MVESTPYMGTKRSLASKVRVIVSELPDGPLLDVFAGMGAVAEAVCEERAVWLNDIQHYAATFSRARFQSSPPSWSSADALDLFSEFYNQNYRALAKRFRPALELESEMIANADANCISSWRNACASRYTRPSVQATLTSLRRSAPEIHQLFTRSYADGYFTVRQAIEIDSVRAAIDRARKSKISKAEEDWLLLALARAIRKAAFTTGHFAQYLTVAPRSVSRFRRVAARRIWDIFLDELGQLPALGVSRAGKSNRVYRSNATSLLRRLRCANTKPAIIYADPPYTADHYSRYYHVWESLTLYDYPAITGKGRYRGDRFQTPFSIKAKVKKSFVDFISASRALDATLVLSYPANGLLVQAGHSPMKLLKEQYPFVQRFSTRHHHSTMGASDGEATAAVTEHIFVARTQHAC